MEIYEPRGGRLHHIFKGEHKQHVHALIITGVIIGIIAIGYFVARVIIDNTGLKEQDVLPGVTFSKKYATELGLNWREAYMATLDDLGARAVRLPVYWDEVESTKGQFDFSDVDWQVREAGRRGVKVILAIGLKVPRWPECFRPEWAKNLSDTELQTQVLSMLKSVTQHFAKLDDFAAWQVENEPLFSFGDCPKPDWQFLRREVSLVKSLDARPVIITESGELSDWVRAASIADILGISTYRDVWNQYLGHVFWPVTPRWYSTRISAVRPLVSTVFVSELQAEPWYPGPIQNWDINEQLKHMNPEHLRSNMSFVRRMGVSEAYLWGVEWWYWLKTKGHSEMWDTGRELFNH